MFRRAHRGHVVIRSFYLYAISRNLRFFEAFFVLFLLLDLELSYTLVGVVLAYEKLLLGICEVPLAVIADRLGRRRALMTSFALASVAFAIFGLAAVSSSATALVFVGQTVYGVGERELVERFWEHVDRLDVQHDGAYYAFKAYLQGRD